MSAKYQEETIGNTTWKHSIKWEVEPPAPCHKQKQSHWPSETTLQLTKRKNKWNNIAWTRGLILCASEKLFEICGAVEASLNFKVPTSITNKHTSNSTLSYNIEEKHHHLP